MVSIIITTKKEPKTLSLAIQAILDQKINQEFEILVIGPDRETQETVKKFSENNEFIKYLKDCGRGKPTAINLAINQAKGDILILTDGDVKIGDSAVDLLLRRFNDQNIGAVTGQPISINSRDNLFGYWSCFLTQAAHQMRLKKKNFSCSGYLYGFRNLIKGIPENSLSEDGLITQIIKEKGLKIVYEPRAEVYVKYPNNLKDWLKQKVRSTGGYVQKFKIGKSKYKTTTQKSKNQIGDTKKLRNFLQEVSGGIQMFFIYPKSVKEFWWTILLYCARIYLWIKILWLIKIKKYEFDSIWERIESTK